jgi:FkbM family methyltransferase
MYSTPLAVWRAVLVHPKPRARSETLYQLRNGAVFRLQSGSHDLHVLNEVWLSRTYEPSPEFAVQPGWLVVDAGANKGAYTVRAALTDPTTMVVAVEPEPGNVEALRVNLALNRVSNVEIREVALSSHSGDDVLHLSTRQGSALHSLLPMTDDRAEALGVKRHQISDEEVTVQTLTLDSLVSSIEHPIDLMKMDIEGSEYDVLHAASNETFQRLARVVLEFHPTTSADVGAVGSSLFDLFVSHGFDCARDDRRHVLSAVRSTGRSGGGP